MKPMTVVAATFLTVGALVAADDPRPKSGGAASSADEQTIRSLLASLEQEWNKHDMKAFSTRLAENADVVNRFGQWMKGRQEIEKHLISLHDSSLRGLLASRSSQVEAVRFLTPDIALAHERTKEQTGESVRTYVLQKRDGRWLVQSADIVQRGTYQAH
jgi:uncharacterized protein (TIGR02246 family)